MCLVSAIFNIVYVALGLLHFLQLAVVCPVAMHVYMQHAGFILSLAAVHFLALQAVRGEMGTLVLSGESVIMVRGDEWDSAWSATSICRGAC